jgi:lipopolysaccharide exporter
MQDRSLLQRLRSRLPDALFAGTSVVMATVIVSNLLRIVSSATLTRLLSAEAFGVVGIISSITFIMGLLSDIGLLPFVVRHKDGLEPRFLDEVWTARVLRGAGLTLIMALLSGPLAAYAGKPELRLVIAVWSVTFLLDGLGSMAFATAVREQRLARLSLLDLGMAVLTIVLSVGFAILLRSYWAIVAASILAGIVKTVLTYALFPGSARRFRLNSARMAELWKFSRYIAGSSVINILLSQTDKMFFARVLSLEAFGLYSLAVTLATAPLGLIFPYSERVLYPAYAKAFRETPERLRAVYYGQRRVVTYLYSLAIGGFIGSAPLVVTLLYDPRYHPVTPMLRLLAISPFFALGNYAADRVLLATGRAWSSLAGNIVRIAWLIVGGAIAYTTGNQLLLIAVVGTIEVPAIVFHWVLLKTVGLFDLREEAVALAIGGAGLAIGAAGSSAIIGWFALT